MNFSVVADAFDQIEQQSSRVEITKLLAVLFKQATAVEAEIICNLCMGLLHPVYVGTVFNLAEKNLIAVVARITKQDAGMVKEQLQKLGDISDVLIGHSWDRQSELTIAQVYDQLCALEKVAGTGSQEHKVHALTTLLESLDQSSAKYVVRMVLGKLRIGFSDMTIIDALSWMEVDNKSLHVPIEEAYNVCADLGLIARTIKEGGMAALKKLSIQVGIPIRPAAAERLPTAQHIIEKLGPCVAQPKLDGFRLQIHVDLQQDAPRVHFFSRHLHDMSTMFPDLVACFTDLPVKTIICEGEAIGYSVETGEFLPFQETVKRRRKHDIEKAAAAFPLRVFLFDMLYLDGESLMSLPHEQRRKKLLKVLPKTDNSLVSVIDERAVTTTEELENYFLSEVAAGLEGLVVKKIDAPYQPGKRNFNWIKLKRRQQGHLEDTIDCVILGYYYGAGRRASFGIGAFLVGVYNKAEDCFQTIAKVGTGLKDEQWKDLKKKCDELVVAHKPNNVVCPKELAPDVWVIPSIVCVVLADEITLSPLHSANKTAKHSGYALRFPRIVAYRDDKSALEVTDVVEINRLYEDQY